MAGALDQPARMIEKLIGYPFQGDAAVRAAVLVNKNLLSLTHGEQLPTLVAEAPAAGIRQLVHATEWCFHQFPFPGSSSAGL